MYSGITVFRQFALAYNAACKPLCRELELPQTAFDILMFLGNNPQYKTASEIVEIRRIKANLVSVHVERLVRDGYLVRRSVKGDRRKIELLCTEKAESVLVRGRRLQQEFGEKLFENIDSDTRAVFENVMLQIEENLNTISEEK